MLRFTVLVPRLPLACVCSAALVACQDDPEPVGQLIVALDTDMALPDAIDQVDITADVQGVRKFSQNYPLGPGSDRFSVPATLTFLSGDDPTEAVRVRVVGRKGERFRTFREIITTVPERRTATLRMPLQWLCDDSADVAPTTDDEGITKRQAISKCDEGFTCRAGTCQPNMEKSADLRDYTPESVFGGAAVPEDGTCFDTLACMVKGSLATTDAECTIARPTVGSVNVALRVSSDGMCDSTKTVCFVPLDHDAKEGWFESNDGERIQLPEAVCTKLDEGTISHVYVSTECVTKVPGMPPCGEWTSAKTSNVPSTRTDPLVQPVLAAALPDTAEPCCPLMMDGDKLYACACTTKSAATVFELEPTSRGARSVATLNPSSMRTNQLFAAAVHDQMLYWAANDVVQLTPLVSGRLASSLDVHGAVFETASVLVDAAAVYVLASGVADVTGPAVKLIKLTAAGERQVFETGGTRAMFQLDQDADAIYAVSAVDQKPASSAKTNRTSSVIRIDKQTGESTPLVPEAALALDANDLDQGGYYAVRVDAAARAIYALFQYPRAANGTVKVEVRKAAIRASAAEPTTLWDLTFNPARTQLRLQGVVDGVVIYSQVNNGDDGKPSGSALLALSEDQLVPRPVQKLTLDFPVPGLGSDAQNIYWLTDAGKLYAFPRSGLR